MKRSYIINIISLILVIAYIAVVFAYSTLEKRIQVLEKQCHALCLYGDADCATRCAKAGHCPFQKE